MSHPLCARYGLSATDLLDAIESRFRLRVAVEGAVAETQVERVIKQLVGKGINRYQMHDQDGMHDFSVWIPGRTKPITIECKNVRNSNEAFRKNGKEVAFKVETQKTRAAKGDHTSRFYDAKQFDVLAVCLGKKTGDWQDIMFIRTLSLERHKDVPTKLAAIQRVPLPVDKDIEPWTRDLGTLLAEMKRS